jgi:hypothetical protein
MSDPMLMEIQKYADHVIMENSGANIRPEDTHFHYPDSSVVEIVGEISRLTHAPVKKVLEDFGRFIAAEMARRARADQAKGDSRTLAVLENVGAELESAVPSQAYAPFPPQFRGQRTSVDEVMVAIEKGRHWCAIMKGFVEEMAHRYGEKVSLSETGCLNQGDAACHLFVSAGE